MRRRILLFLLMGILCLAAASCNGLIASGQLNCDEPMATVAPQDKVLYPDDTVSYEGKSLKSLCSCTHAVIRGRILSIEEGTIPNKVRVFDKESAEGTQFRMEQSEVTNYRVKVDKVFYGNLKRGDTITYTLYGRLDSYITKPQEPGDVVLLMNEYQYPDRTMFGTVGFEHGIFTVDPCGRVYSYSDFEELCAYDGKDAGILENDLEQVIRELKDSGYEWPEVPIIE